MADVQKEFDEMLENVEVKEPEPEPEEEPVVEEESTPEPEPVEEEPTDSEPEPEPEPEEEPAGEEPEPEPEPETDYEAQIERLRQSLAEMSVNVAPPAEQPKDGEAPEQSSAKQPSGDGPVFVESEEELDALLRTPDGLNKALRKVYQQAREDIMRDIDPQIRRVVSHEVGASSQAQLFFQENPDLIPYKKFVGYLASQLETQHPEWDDATLLENLAKESRTQLALSRGQGKSNNDNSAEKPRPSGNRQRASTPPSTGRGGARKDQRSQSKLEKEFEDILPEYFHIPGKKGE